MEDFLKRIHFNLTASAVITLLIGVVLLIWPGKVLGTAAKVVGIALIIAGAVMLLGVLARERSGLLGGIVLLALGIWVMSHTRTIVSIFPVIAGVLLLVHAIQEIRLSFEARALHSLRWWWGLLVAALTVILALICIFNGFGVVSLVVRAIGVFLVYDGISDIIVIERVAKARRDSVVDTEGVVVDED